MLDKDRIVEMIRRHFEETGEVPGLDTFHREHPDVLRTAFAGLYWSRWSGVVRDAGLAPREFTRTSDDRVVSGTLAEITRELGRYPTQAELRLRRKTGALAFDPAVTPLI